MNLKLTSGQKLGIIKRYGAELGIDYYNQFKKCSRD